MKPTRILLHFTLTAAAILAANNLRAQTVAATGTISGVFVSGVYDYTLTINNAGNVPLEGFWYGWTPGGNNLPSNPTTAASTSGWSVLLDNNSIQYQGTSGDAIPVSGSETFTFDSSSTPAQMVAGGSGQSTIYAGTIGLSGNSPGVSEVFTPTAVPEPSTLGLLFTGSLGFLGAGWRRLRAR